MSVQPIHTPVLSDEVVAWLAPQPGSFIVDGTLGGGGHTRALAAQVGDAGTVLSFDRDPAAIAAAEVNLRGLPVKLTQRNFCELPVALQELGQSAVDGIVLDLGLSSDQLADRQRGFSFDSAGPLDLRFDPEEGAPAWRLLERMREEPLADLIYAYGEERYSRRIARKIVAARRTSPVRTAQELAALVRSCIPQAHRQNIDAATRTFQALRIAVNDELKSLEQALKYFPECLRPGGRLAIISFHSLEDRRVKHAFRDDDRLNVLTKKPVRPSEQEEQRNPRSRSSRLRVAERV